MGGQQSGIECDARTRPLAVNDPVHLPPCGQRYSHASAPVFTTSCTTPYLSSPLGETFRYNAAGAHAQRSISLRHGPGRLRALLAPRRTV